MKTLFDKYAVTKKVGETDPNAQYFVLRIDKDPHARVAMKAYINSIHGEEPEFARQLAKWLGLVESPNYGLWMLAIYLQYASMETMKLLAEGILINNRHFTVKEWCGAGKPFSQEKFLKLQREMFQLRMLVPSSVKDVRQGFVLTELGRATLSEFLNQSECTIVHE